MSANTEPNLETDNLANEDCRPVPCSQCVLVVRDRGTDGDPTIIIKKDLDEAKAHKRRIIERVSAIQLDECPFEIEIFHLVPANAELTHPESKPQDHE